MSYEHHLSYLTHLESVNDPAAGPVVRRALPEFNDPATVQVESSRDNWTPDPNVVVVEIWCSDADYQLLDPDGIIQEYDQ